jgi:conjugal transfer pilus assembly protein TraV
MRQSSINLFHFFGSGFFLCAFLLSGCSALVSPYSTTFQCPDSDKGKCVSVQTAYNESVEDNPLVREPADAECDACEETADKKKEEKRGHKEQGALKELKYHYQDSLYKKMTAILEQPETPFVIAPDVIRVLIPSYTGSDNALYGSRYVYFFVTDPQWSLSSATVDTE